MDRVIAKTEGHILQKIISERKWSIKDLSGLLKDLKGSDNEAKIRAADRELGWFVANGCTTYIISRDMCYTVVMYPELREDIYNLISDILRNKNSTTIRKFAAERILLMGIIDGAPEVSASIVKKFVALLGDEKVSPIIQDLFTRALVHGDNKHRKIVIDAVEKFKKASNNDVVAERIDGMIEKSYAQIAKNLDLLMASLRHS